MTVFVLGLSQTLLYDFYVTCFDWKDDGNVSAQKNPLTNDMNNNAAGLTYELRIRHNSSQEIGQFIHRSTNSSFPKLQLPVVGDGKDVAVELLVRIVDIYGAYTSLSIHTQVR